MTLLWMALGLGGIIAVITVFGFCRDAAIRRSGLLPAAGQATMADVERLARDGHRLVAIRCYREIHHVGSAEAKKAVDDLRIKS
jgi:hypothetical protein